jgi:hypothetical protein
MRQRTFKFTGVAIGECIVDIKFDNTTIYNGAIPAQFDQIDYSIQWHNVAQELVQASVAYTKHNIPLQIQVHKGTLFFGGITANYTASKARPYNTHPRKLFYPIVPDPKMDVYISGTEVIKPANSGEWFYQINTNDTFTCNIVYNSKLEALLPPELQFVGTPDPFSFPK